MDNIKLNNDKTHTMAFLSYSLAAVFGCTGLYKLWVYTPMEEDIYGDMIGGANAIVGGDAYNCLWQDKRTYICSPKVHNSASSL